MGQQFDALTLSNSANKNTRVWTDANGYLYVLPDSGGTSDRIYLHSNGSTSQGCLLFMDESLNQFWISPKQDTAGHDLDLYLNVNSGKFYDFQIGFATKMRVASTSTQFFSLLTSSISDASGNTVLEAFRCARTTTGTPAAGLGAALSWGIENSVGSTPTVGFWEAIYEDPTSTTESTCARLRVTSAGSYADSNNLFVISGAANAVGIGHTAYAPGTSSTYFKSKLDVHGSIGTDIREVSGNTTLDIEDSTVLVDASSGAVTITLPTAASSTRRKYTIKKIDSSTNAVTIDGDGSETIDGLTTYVITTQYVARTVQSDGTEWWLI